MLAVVEDTRTQAADAHAAWSERFSEVFAQVAGSFANARVRRHGRSYLLGAAVAGRAEDVVAAG